jgi:hypothetical protein
MILVRLVYASRFKHSEYDPKELARILEKATVNNAVAEITGTLVFGDDYFLQCLEGGREAVNRLFAKISHDPRHDNVLLLGYEEISERQFGDWSMKLVLLSEKKAALVKRFSTTSAFNPLKMSSKSALELLMAMRE